MDNRGYIFTLVTVIMSLLLVSLYSFYVESSESGIESLVNRVGTDELHYFIESLKNDFERAIEISGRKSAAYATGRIINSSLNLTGYVMHNCTSFNYSYYSNDSQAAIAELMLCGTLEGNSLPGMENNTLPNWTGRIESQYSKYNVEANVINLTMAMYNPWNFAVIAVVEIAADNRVAYYRNNDTIVSLVSIIGLEDPLYYLRTGEPDILPEFQVCQNSGTVTGGIINGWIDSACYLASNNTYEGPSFFDRLDGNSTLNSRYSSQSLQYFSSNEIGLESFADIYGFWRHDVPVDNSYSWVDYLYWNSTGGGCCVDGTRDYTETYPDLNLSFRIDQKHVDKYGIEGTNCENPLGCSLVNYP